MFPTKHCFERYNNTIRNVKGELKFCYIPHLYLLINKMVVDHSPKRDKMG